MSISQSPKRPTLFLLELNEFNLDLFDAAVKSLPLPALSRVAKMPRAHLSTEDVYASNFLEPWVQWVSVHTGTPTTGHKVQHLGDVPTKEFPQFWETLGERGFTTGLWGVMNATRRDAKGCMYFLPDPWTFSERAYPEELNELLDLPRYLSTNYLKISKMKASSLAGKFLKRLVLSVGLPTLVSSLDILFKGLFAFGPKHLVFIVWFEYLSAMSMLKRYDQRPPDLNVLFVNSLAHLQHHYWTKGTGTVTPELAYGFRMVDRVVQEILARTEDGALIITNAFQQINTNSDPAWILYRPHDQHEFLTTIGLKHVSVESLMTHDAHIFFESPQDAEMAEGVLRNAVIGGKRLFEVDRNSPTKVFYRIDFFDDVPGTTEVTINAKTFTLNELFVRIVKRTGKHSQDGVAFSRGISLPNDMRNHELCASIIGHFKG
jgi:hypothetical protein